MSGSIYHQLGSNNSMFDRYTFDNFLLKDPDRITLFVFFSSRRRHTRWPRDWSSDVCSSDLGQNHSAELFLVELAGEGGRIHQVAEHHGELAAFGLRGLPCVRWVQELRAGCCPGQGAYLPIVVCPW